MSNITVVRPEKDNIEIILSDWAGVILGGCRGSSTINLIDLKGSAANRLQVEKDIANADLILYFGHGENHKIGSPKALLDNANIGHCANKILISIACNTANNIGQKAIHSGVKSFIGFDDILAIYLGKPSIFGAVFEQALLPLLTGNSNVSKTRDAAISLFKSIEHLYMNSGANDPNAALIWMSAHINWRGIQAYGDLDARV